MKVGSREIGGNAPCFIVAEVGLAHEGRFDLAERLVDLAAESGADAVKFQAYKTEDLINKDRDPERWKRFKRKELRPEDFYDLRAHAEWKKIIWFCTPHTMSAFEFLNSLDVPLWKIGSGESNDSPILRAAVETGKPVFISTGLRDEKGIEDLILRLPRFRDIALLHCITMYPVTPQRANLGFLGPLEHWCRSVGAVMGYSDHSVGTLACEVAVSMGAKIIEKHIKLPESTGQDVHGALFADEFKGMVGRIREIETMIGSSTRQYSEEEKENEKWALKGKDGLRPL
jgi:N,N'-diacetyllegionaminate synthase